MAGLALNGELYGTTESGGTNDYGSDFKVSPSGSERVLYRFKGPLDAGSTVATVIAMDGALYGTTFEGGANFGTIFRSHSIGSVRAGDSWRASR